MHLGDVFSQCALTFFCLTDVAGSRLHPDLVASQLQAQFSGLLAFEIKGRGEVSVLGRLRMQLPGRNVALTGVLGDQRRHLRKLHFEFHAAVCGVLELGAEDFQPGFKQLTNPQLCRIELSDAFPRPLPVEGVGRGVWRRRAFLSPSTESGRIESMRSIELSCRCPRTFQSRFSGQPQLSGP